MTLCGTSTPDAVPTSNAVLTPNAVLMPLPARGWAPAPPCTAAAPL